MACLKRPLSLTEKITILLLLLVVVLRHLKYFAFADFYGQHLICRYICNGVNPYVPQSAATLAQLGLQQIPPGFGTSPWGCVLGMLFYPGFLPADAARIWLVLLFAVAFVGFIAYAVHVFPRHRQTILLTSLATVIPYLASYIYGNAGGIICILLFMALLLMESGHVVLAGVCLAFAMVKPQAAMLVCLYLLLERRYKPLVVAAVMVVGAWWLTARILDAGMLDLIGMMFGANIGGGGQFMGILSRPLRGTPFAQHSLFLSMAAGTLYAVTLYSIIKRRRPADRYLPLLPFCVATAFWSYNTLNELAILMPLACYCIYIFNKVSRLTQKMFLGVIIFLCSFSYVIIYCLTVVFLSSTIALQIFSVLLLCVFPFTLRLPKI